MAGRREGSRARACPTTATAWFGSKPPPCSVTCASGSAHGDFASRSVSIGALPYVDSEEVTCDSLSMIRASLLISILVAACGGSKSEPVATPPATADKGHEESNMTAEVKAFHDSFAPHYHAAKNPERMKGTCAAIPEFTSGAATIAKAPTPAGVDAAVWTDATGKLAASIEGLDGACKANDAAAFDPAIETMHKNFHAVMEAAGGHHEGGQAHPEMKPQGGGY